MWTAFRKVVQFELIALLIINIVNSFLEIPDIKIIWNLSIPAKKQKILMDFYGVPNNKLERHL